MELKNAGREKKIAVLTGGTGYIGRSLNLYLLDNGWDTVLIVRSGSKKSCQMGNVSANCRFLEYDGTQESLAKLQLDADAKVVFFHLATHSGASGTAGNLDQLIDSNIRFGAHLLDYMVKNNHCNFIFSESYWQFDHEGRLSGNTLYATTKSAFSLLSEIFSNNLNVISLVLYDVYGPRDDRGKLINLLITSAVTQEPINMTQGEQWLDYVYIDDVVQAFEVAGRSLLASPVKNRGSFCRHTVRTMEVRKLKEFVHLLSEAVGRAPNVIWGAKQYPSHQLMNPWFPSASYQLPGWQSNLDFNSGIKKVIKHE